LKSLGIWILATAVLVAYSGAAAGSYAKDDCEKYWYVPGTAPSAENAKGHFCIKLETSKRQGEPDSYFVHIPKSSGSHSYGCNGTLGANCFTMYEETNKQAGLQTRPGCLVGKIPKICWAADTENEF